MVNETTINKLYEMRLPKMAEAFKNQLLDQSFSALSFEERFGLMVDGEWSRRRNNRLDKLIRGAGLQYSNACLENIEYHNDRQLDRAQIARLSSCNYLSERHNIIILGASGAGKTYLSCAFGIAACRNFYNVKYIRLPEMLYELAIARGEGILKKVISNFKRVRLLIIDEWLLSSINDIEARDLLEIIDARHKQSSTIFSSQFSPAGWHGKIGEGTLADAILDRIVHDSYTIKIEGDESMRKRKGLRNSMD